MAKCPECLGHNAFEVIPDYDPDYEEDESQFDQPYDAQMECYDCGHTWTESMEESIERFDQEESERNHDLP